ncbi:MAG: helix-turn-helix domain-containing protein [Candidatus Humimicrobiaceae bacterium]
MEKKDAFISEKIRQIRILKNRSQEDLGKYIGLPKQAVSRIEKTQRKVSYFELSKIAEFLEEPIEAFVVEDIKNKLIHIGNSVAAIPKFAFDFLTDFKKFLYKYSKEEAKVITDEICNQMKNIYEVGFLNEYEREQLEIERDAIERMQNEYHNLH